MKRDMDLIREILIRIESWDLRQMGDLDFTNYSRAEVDYNLELTFSAGLINGSPIAWALDNTLVSSILGLTWEGHDFLDAIREKSVWDETKRTIEGSGLHHIPFELLKETASTILKSILNPHLPIGF